jgi:hypothetical protein
MVVKTDRSKRHLNSKYTREDALRWRDEMRRTKMSMLALAKSTGVSYMAIRDAFAKYDL